MTDNYRPTVGDKVILLRGGGLGTWCNPPLRDGEIYTIQQDDKDASPYRLNGLGSFVCEFDVKLVEKAASNNQEEMR